MPARKTLSWLTAVRSYKGYLEGTGKSKHTISSYLSDVRLFGVYLTQHSVQNAGKEIKLPDLKVLTAQNLDEYGAFLKAEGQRINTRRRKLLSVRRFLKFLGSRKKVSDGLGARLPAPHKHEVLPYAPDFNEVRRFLLQSEVRDAREARDQILIWTLLETGCLVSEVSTIGVQAALSRGEIEVLDKEGVARHIPISSQYAEALENYQDSLPQHQKTLFLGWNRHGPFTERMSPRGVELVVKQFSRKFDQPHLTPRSLRHAAVLEWMKEGVSSTEIQRRLGLKSDYAFRIYDSLFKSKTQTTATEGASP